MSGALCGGSRRYTRWVGRCPTCARQRPHVTSWPSSGWYPPTVTCLGCGDAWSDGERLPRPFARGWRQRAKKDAAAKWATADRFEPVGAP